MSAELLRQATGRLAIRCMTVNSEAHPNPVEVEKWREEWEALAAWLRLTADFWDSVGLRGAPMQGSQGAQAIAVARVILGAEQ